MLRGIAKSQPTSWGSKALGRSDPYDASDDGQIINIIINGLHFMSDPLPAVS